ncbi:MAG: DUF481 domain-containing protein, partial [Verrucomicrobiota bacterium]
ILTFFTGLLARRPFLWSFSSWLQIYMKGLCYSLLIAVSFLAVPSSGVAEKTEAQLRKELAELKKLNEDLQSQAATQQTEITRLKDEVTRLQQPAAPEPASQPLSEKAKNIWDTEVAIGANLSRGNNDSHRVKGAVKGTRKTEVDRLILSLEAESGENEGSTTSEYIEGSADYRRDIHDRLFWYALLEGRRDAIADLDYRFTLSPGLGYKVIDEEKIQLSFEAGPAYVLEQLSGEDLEHSIRGRVGQELTWQITSYAKLFQSLEFLSNLQETGDWIVEAEVGVETSITDSFSLRFSVKDIYDNQPAAGRQENDMSLNSAIVYKFK